MRAGGTNFLHGGGRYPDRLVDEAALLMSCAGWPRAGSPPVACDPVINDELPATFRKWYPTFAAANEPCAAAA